MKQKMISLALLACFSGFASAGMALEITSGTTHTDDISINNEAFINNGTINNSSIVIGNDTSTVFQNNGDISTGIFDLTTKYQNPVFSGSISASERITYKRVGPNANAMTIPLNATLSTPLLQIIGDNAQSGFLIADDKVIENVQRIEINGIGPGASGRTALSFTGNANVNSQIVFTGTGDSRIELADGASATFAQIISDSNEGKIQANGTNSITVNSLSVAEGKKLNLEVLGGNNEAKPVFNLGEITVEDGGRLNASVYSDNQPNMTIAGDLNINLGSDAVVDFGGTKNVDWKDTKINITSKNINVNVVDSDNAGTVYLSQTGGMDVENTNITVNATGNNNTGNAASDLNKIANVVQLTSKDAYTGDPSEVLNTSAADGTTLTVAANDIFDGAQGTVVTDQNGQARVENVSTTANPNVHGIAEMAALSLHIWRNEINDMNKRLGELRDSSAQSNGVWARVYNGRAEFGDQNITNKYTAFQFGYDRQVTDGLWLGGALSYTDGNNDFDYGDGDSSLMAFTVYGSKLWDSGLFLDVTGKFGRLKNEFDISLPGVNSSGDYHTNAYSVSAEAGWRFYPSEVIFVEPQVELMYGRVDSVDYKTSTGIKVKQDSAQALIGRAGFMLGIECPEDRGNAYVRASVLHDWEGDADFSFSKAGTGYRSLSEELGGTWYEYGIGFNFNATEQTHVYADLEASDGGEVDTDYRINVGVRYAW